MANGSRVSLSYDFVTWYSYVFYMDKASQIKTTLIPYDNVSGVRSYITPLFKKGSRHDPDNYRPIALTATMCKLMESINKKSASWILIT
jgi:hypothetical protein